MVNLSRAKIVVGFPSGKTARRKGVVVLVHTHVRVYVCACTVVLVDVYVSVDTASFFWILKYSQPYSSSGPR